MQKKIFLPIIVAIIYFVGINFQPGTTQNNWSKLYQASAAPSAIITVCASACDYSSIQDAINGASPGDILELGAQTFTEAITINKNLSLSGTGHTTTIIQAASSTSLATSRVITITAGTTALIEGVTIQHGSTSDLGGGIFNQGNLTVQNSLILNNEANYGGGIANQTDNGNATLNITESTVSENSALSGGAGLYNLATQNGQTSQIDLNKVTIDNNDAGEGGGGGIFNRAMAGNANVNIKNTTIDGNSAEGVGGGILNNQSSGNANVDIQLSTINNNAASPGSNLYVSSGEVYLAQSILANGFGGGDCELGSGSVIDNQFNLVEDGSCGFNVGGDPKINFLADNGGSTKTNALQANSPALDQIPASQCLETSDQRNESRPFGAGCDIGAFELHQQDLTFSIHASNTIVSPNEIVTFTIPIEPIGPGISNGVVTGEKSEELILQGDIILQPPNFGTVGPYPPTLVHGLTISANLTATLTMHTQVATGIPGGTQLSNQVSITSTEFITPVVSTATLTVKNVPPVAVDDDGANFTTNPTSAFITGNVLDNDYDLNGDTIIYISSTSGDLLGSLTDYKDGTFFYDPGVAFEDLLPGEVDYDIFTYSITDGLGGIVQGSVTITIYNAERVVFLPFIIK